MIVKNTINSTSVSNSELRNTGVNRRHGTGDRHPECFTLLQVENGFAKLAAYFLWKQANGGPGRRMKNRQLHVNNVSYLRHMIKNFPSTKE